MSRYNLGRSQIKVDGGLSNLSNCLDYVDGILYWNKNQCRQPIGKPAGTIDKGRILISYAYKKYQASRVVWYKFHGDTNKFIDHIDRNPLNNNIDNLREVTHSQNQMNSFSNRVSRNTRVLGLLITKIE